MLSAACTRRGITSMDSPLLGRRSTGGALCLKHWVKGDLRRREAIAGHRAGAEQNEGSGIERWHAVRHRVFLYFYCGRWQWQPEQVPPKMY